MDDEDSLIRGRQNDMRENEMKPDYYDEFQCIADACSLTCCQEWKIAVDRKTAVAWKKTEMPEGVRPKRRTLSDYTKKCGDGRIITLDEKMRCPFLDERKLCRLVLTYGDAVLSETCTLFPREKHEVAAGITEYSLMPCCPAVVDLLWGRECIRFSDEADSASYGAYEAVYGVRKRFLTIMSDRAYRPAQSLCMLFYMALDLCDAGTSWKAEVPKYGDAPYRKELADAVEHAGADCRAAFVERNELFLDLAENYRKEGLYRAFLTPAAEEAEQIAEDYGKIRKEDLDAFAQAFSPYEALMRCYLQSEIFSECLGEPDDVEYVTVKLQWIALEYAAIRHAAFLCWHREGALSYETMRSCMVILSRMLGYEDEDIWEYLENSFERLIWDWGYFALVVS